MKKDGKNDLLKELEIKRIQSEIARNDEEQLKIEFERKELERKAKLRWYRKKEFYTSVGTILVFATVFWFYAEKFLVPMMQAENTRLTLANQKQSEGLAKQEKQFQEKEEIFRAEYVEKMKEQRAEYTRLKAQEAQLATRYKNLSNSLAISETDKLRYLSQYNIIKMQMGEKDNKINELSSKIQSEEIRKYIGGNVNLTTGVTRDELSQTPAWFKPYTSPTVTSLPADSSWGKRLLSGSVYDDSKSDKQNLGLINIPKGSSNYNFGRTDSPFRPLWMLNTQTQSVISLESMMVRTARPVTLIDSFWLKLKR